MGIQNLLPFVAKSCRSGKLAEFAGCSIAIDAGCLLHQRMKDDAANTDNEAYISCLKKYVDPLIALNCHVIMVFDGRPLPAKKDTNAERSVTSKVVEAIIQHFRKSNLVDFIVAPYESNAQLAYLMREKLADVVVTENADLIAFECEKIIFKLDVTGPCTIYEREKLPACFSGKMASEFDFTTFRRICILSGCDYLQGLKGVGLSKALQFFLKTSKTDLREILPRVPSYLRMPKLKVTDAFIEDFIRAEMTFLHQVVFDPRDRCQRPLTAYPLEPETVDNAATQATIPYFNDDDDDFAPRLGATAAKNGLNDYSFAGTVASSSEAIRLALGNHNQGSLLEDPFHLPREIPDWSVWNSHYETRSQQLTKEKAEKDKMLPTGTVRKSVMDANDEPPVKKAAVEPVPSPEVAELQEQLLQSNDKLKHMEQMELKGQAMIEELRKRVKYLENIIDTKDGILKGKSSVEDDLKKKVNDLTRELEESQLRSARGAEDSTKVGELTSQLEEERKRSAELKKKLVQIDEAASTHFELQHQSIAAILASVEVQTPLVGLVSPPAPSPPHQAAPTQHKIPYTTDEPTDADVKAKIDEMIKDFDLTTISMKQMVRAVCDAFPGQKSLSERTSSIKAWIKDAIEANLEVLRRMKRSMEESRRAKNDVVVLDDEGEPPVKKEAEEPASSVEVAELRQKLKQSEEKYTRQRAEDSAKIIRLQEELKESQIRAAYLSEQNDKERRKYAYFLESLWSERGRSGALEEIIEIEKISADMEKHEEPGPSLGIATGSLGSHRQEPWDAAVSPYTTKRATPSETNEGDDKKKVKKRGPYKKTRERMDMMAALSQRDALHECELAIKDTMGQYFAWPFIAPVNGREVPDYHLIIKHPMDLQTMVRKIKNNTYDSLVEVQQDLDQMTANCKEYYEDGSELIEMAVRTSGFLQPKLESIARKSQR